MTACVGTAFPAPAANADTAGIIAPSDPANPQVDSGWQAGTCAEEPPESADFCSVATVDQYFQQAAGHPPYGFTQFIIKHEEPLPGAQKPVGELKTVRVDLPPGLTVNPQATPQCALATFEDDPASCPPESAVGESLVTASVGGIPIELPTPPTVYNIVPEPGEPARFGFNLLGNNVYLEADVAWESDYHEGFTIHVPKTPFADVLELGLPFLQGGVVLKNRLVFDGTAGDGTFITTPNTCLGEATPDSPFKHVYSTWLLASSIAEEKEAGYSFPASARPPFESRIPPGTSPKECASVPFDPSLSVDPDTDRTDSPSGATVTVNVPEITDPSKEGKQASSHVRSARVTLPAGMGLNPSAARGLEACTDAQFGKGTRRPIACPAASRIGTVEIDTPPLPDGSLSGPVFVGRQLSRDPTSGDLYRIFVAAESSRYGISARLLGRVRVDPRTGRITTVFDDAPSGRIPLPGLPQVPFESFRIDLDDGATAVLTSPSICGPNESTTAMVPWSGGAPAQRSDSFALTSGPGGGECAASLGDRPFDPGFEAAPDSSRAGSFSPLNMEIDVPQGDQELKGVDVTLPPGLTAKLAGVEYCSEGDIAAAADRSGEAEQESSICPPESYVGSADIRTGSGPDPIEIGGKVFLAGPYEGAPLSLAVITPATAGPFDLGTVVVRVALHVDPVTAQVRAESDPIPHVYGGAMLDIRSVSVQLDRRNFSLNGTNCQESAFTGDLLGGGGDPTDPGSFSSDGVSSGYRATGCERLGFNPRLFLRMFGAKRRAGHPKLRAVLLAPKGQANVGRAAVTLPSSLILDQANISNVCTRVQYAADECPRNSVYGYARAFSPLLDEPLQGPVILRSSDNVLPDLVSKLRGQVSIDLASRTDSVRGRIRNVFPIVPDVPVSAFLLVLRGGPKGILVNSDNQCPRPLRLAAIKRRRAAARRDARRGDAAAASRRPVSRAVRRKRVRQRRARVRKHIRALTLAANGFNGHNGKKVRRAVRVNRDCTPRPNRRADRRGRGGR